MKFIDIDAPVVLSIQDMGMMESMSLEDIHTLPSYQKWGKTALNTYYVYKIFHKPNTSIVVYSVNADIYGTPYILELYDTIKSARVRYYELLSFLNM